MKCAKCGYDNPSGIKFCGMCGTRLPFVCPECGFDNPSEFRFCGMCGARLPLECPACGYANASSHRYCAMCGTLLEEIDRSVESFVQLQQETLEPSAPSERTSPSRVADVQSPSRPVPAQAPLRGERRQATAILADVKRSTDLMEQIGTEAWVEMMNNVFQILEAEIYRFGGEVDQFRGDEVVAFFGTKAAHEDDPERAVLAALEMQKAIKAYAAELSEREGIELALRVGINTGEVIVANIGDSSQYSEDTAMGGAVALASRMESSAEPGTVLVSEDTYRLVQSRFEWEALGEIRVQGISRPVSVYRPLAPRVEAQRSLRLETYGLSSLLVGREEQFETLKSCVEGLRAGRGGIVMLSGDEGMGKSHLVSQVRQQDMRDLALQAKMRGSDDPSKVFPVLTWLQGRCRSYEQSRPYSMWLDLLRNWVGISEGQSKTEMRDRLRSQAEALWGDGMVEFYPYLATLLSLPLEEEFAGRVAHLDAEGREQIWLILRNWVEAMARRGPLAVILEDVHWVDASSLETLEYCLPLCERGSLLWLIMFRLGRSSEVWSFHHRIETNYPRCLVSLTLPPLTEAQSGEMIDRLIGSRVLPEKTRVLVIEKAGGNPYYIEELVQSLIRKGALVRDAETGTWTATRAVTLPDLHLPDTLRGLLLASIDHLSSQERHVLQMAAVIGYVFWSSVLHDLIGDEDVLEGHLAALQRSQLIRERGRVPELGTEYAFKSTMVRDVAYESLLSTLQVTYHLQVAEYLESFFGLETLPRYYDLLAYHYRCAGAANKELFYALQAAEQAKEIYANAEALKHYARVLELLAGLEAQATDADRLYAIRAQRFEALNGRREVYYLMGDFEAMWADAQALLPLAQQLDDDPAWLIDALLCQPGVAGWRDREDLDEGIPMAQQALSLAQKQGDRHREMQSLVALARQGLWVNDSEGGEYAERALGLARQLGDQRYEVGILTGMGHAYASREPQRSIACLEAALPISRALDDKMSTLGILNLMGIQLESSDDYYRRLTECHEEALRLSREIGHRPAMARSLMFCGQIRGLYLGDHETGSALLVESLHIREDMPSELYSLLRLAQIRIVQGRYDEAHKILERARRIGDREKEQLGLTGLDLVSSILYNSLGNEAHLRMALDLTARSSEVVFDDPQLTQQYQMVAACESGAAHLGLAEVVADTAERHTHLRQALESSQAALDIYQSCGFVQPIECVSEEILFRHGNALAANGHQKEAVECLQRAYDEMMRKHDLIPPDSLFRRTYVENIPLHRDIRAAYSASVGTS